MVKKSSSLNEQQKHKAEEISRELDANTAAFACIILEMLKTLFSHGKAKKYHLDDDSKRNNFLVQDGYIDADSESITDILSEYTGNCKSKNIWKSKRVPERYCDKTDTVISQIAKEICWRVLAESGVDNVKDEYKRLLCDQDFCTMLDEATDSLKIVRKYFGKDQANHLTVHDVFEEKTH